MIRCSLLLSLLLVTLPSVAADHGIPKKLAPQITVFHNYQIRLLRIEDPHQVSDVLIPGEKHSTGFEILKDGNRVYAGSGYSFTIGYFLSQDQSPDSVKLRIGDDITGEGVPELLISEWSGGAHCCYTFHLFRLSEQFSHIQDIPLLDADESAFVRRLGIKGLVLVSNDYSAFAYFPKNFAESPAGRVFLSFQDSRFKPDARLMKANAPSDAEITKCADLFKPSLAWKQERNASQPMGMWYYATDLIYTGNAAQAWTFLDAAWGGSAADKKRYLDDYRQRFKKSVYYLDLMQLQQAPASSSGQKIDWTKQCFAYLHG